MDDDLVLQVVLGLAVGILLAVLAYSYYNPPRHDEAIAAGTVVVGMTEAEVAEVWGKPDQVLGSGLRTTGILGQAERYSWIYYDPYRKVTFSSEGFGERVVRIQTSQ